MFFYDPPEHPRVRRAHRLSFKKDGCTPLEQGAVNNVRVPDDPAHIRSGPENIALCQVVNSPHGPLQGNHVAAIIPNNPFWNTGCPRCIEDVQGIRGGYGNAVRRDGIFHLLMPVVIKSRCHGSGFLQSLNDDAGIRF